MTSNNLEAIELIKNRILDSGVLREHDRKFSTIPQDYNQILTADALAQYIVPLLQADEKPTKETKLGAFKEELMARKSYFDITDLVELIDILEEKY